MLTKLGATLASYLGAVDCGAKPSYFRQLFSDYGKFYQLADLFPYQAYNAAEQLFINEGGVGFVLEIPPLVGNSEEMQQELSSLFQYVLPETSSLQIMLFADPHIGPWLNHWRNYRINAATQDLAQDRVQHLSNLVWQAKPYILRNFRCIVSYSQVVPNHNEVAWAQVNEVKQQIKTTFEMLKLPVTVWDAEQLINSLGHIINLAPGVIEQLPRRWEQQQTLSQQIATLGTNLTVGANELSKDLASIKIRSYTATQIPSLWSLHAMGKLIGDEHRDPAQIPCPFILHYGVHVPKQAAPQAAILTKASYVERQARSPIGKYLPAIMQEAEELALAREQLGRGERVVQTQFSVILFAKDGTLAQAEQILMNLYLNKEWQLRPNRFFHLPVLMSALPMMWGNDWVQTLAHCHKLKTTLSIEAANLLPLQGEWRGTPTPGMLLCGRRGQLMNWWPFDNQSGNYNVCVVGRSGAGKSTFMQELLATTLDLGGKVFVMDVGRSFQHTCLLRGGQFIEFTPTTNLCINPFSTIPVDDPEVAADALAMLKSVFKLMASPTQGVDDLEAALLEQAIMAVWQQQQQQSNVSLVAECLLNYPEQKAKELGRKLFPFTSQGNYGRYFNGPATCSLAADLVVVELEELKERKDLQGVIVQMFIINITNRVFLGDRKTPFTIVFDEAWDLLRGAQSGVFLETLARRLRRYHGSLVVGTQSVNDLFATPAAQAAFDNSDWMCLLAQKPESIEQLKKTSRLSLTPAMEAELKSVTSKHGEYAEIMLYGSFGFAIGRLMLDPYAQLSYSSKANDYAATRALVDDGYSLSAAIRQVLVERGQHG